MTLFATSIVLATIVYIAYNAVSVAYFGLPQSLSMTYYLWKNESNLGYLFPIVMYAVVMLMMPSWITMSEGSNFQFLAFLAPAAIAFVATAPAFMSSSLENKVHCWSAVIAAVCSVLWVVLVTPYWWIALICLAIVAVVAMVTKSYRYAYIYWLETAAFIATFISALLYSI